MKILYFFSRTCPHCLEVRPVVRELSRDYAIEGFLFGTGEETGMPFPVKRADKKIASRYDIRSVPVMVVLIDGKVKQKISGESDIKDSPPILKAFRMGAKSVSEAQEFGPDVDFLITGWLVHKGNYFDKNAKFYLTDRQREIEVKTWLPLEAVKSPFKKAGPRVMSDFVNRPVTLKGRLLKKDSGLQFTVKEQIF